MVVEVCFVMDVALVNVAAIACSNDRLKNKRRETLLIRGLREHKMPLELLQFSINLTKLTLPSPPFFLA